MSGWLYNALAVTDATRLESNLTTHCQGLDLIANNEEHVKRLITFLTIEYSHQIDPWTHGWWPRNLKPPAALDPIITNVNETTRNLWIYHTWNSVSDSYVAKTPATGAYMECI